MPRTDCRTIRRSQRLRRGDRRATAVIELAVCLPLLVLIVVATIEACTMLHVAQVLKVSAYEGARVGLVPGAESENVEHHCQTLLKSMSIRGAEVITSPPNPADLVEGEFFKVIVRTPYGSNSLLNGWMFAEKIIERTAALRFE